MSLFLFGCKFMLANLLIYRRKNELTNKTGIPIKMYKKFFGIIISYTYKKELSKQTGLYILIFFNSAFIYPSLLNIKSL
ncbi:hypothetical protein AP3564_15510 [Aeribacillus pallidus]|uniref:Uncharacterized protein n=1 Tax=Aeribacillus pallidus TaxID=33936 RepID=A0A223E8I4_9BACI|nr:hypothetical protein AP3564_15510 [Aeribacillus pallidus]